MSAARIAPGGRGDVGLFTWAFSRVAGRVGRTTPPNLFLTLGRHRKLFRRWLWFAGALMPGGKLPRRDTELVILRVAHLRACQYEREHHERLGRRAGLDHADLARVAEGPDADGWSPREHALLTTVDRLHRDGDLDDAAWSSLRGHLDERRGHRAVHARRPLRDARDRDRRAANRTRPPASAETRMTPRPAPAQLPRGRHGLSRKQVVESQRGRMLRAMADAMAEKGYANTSVADVIARAGVSRETFYEQFGSKQDCFLAAFDAAGEILLGRVTGAAPDEGTPADRFEQVLGVYLETLASEPAYARLFLVEAHAAGPEAIRRRVGHPGPLHGGADRAVRSARSPRAPRLRAARLRARVHRDLPPRRR